MKLIKKISIILLTVQLLYLYSMYTDRLENSMGCCGRSKSIAAQSCPCSSDHNLPTLKNNFICTCMACFNDQTLPPVLLTPGSDFQYILKKFDANCKSLELRRPLDLFSSVSRGLLNIPITDRYPPADNCILNCTFLI